MEIIYRHNFENSFDLTDSLKDPEDPQVFLQVENHTLAEKKAEKMNI